MTKQMNAIVINEYGGRDQLTQTQMPIPEISDHQLLVKVVSIGVNPIDWKVREGLRKKRYNFEFPIILGQEMAGVVAEVGKDVTGFKVGDAVLGYGTPNNRGTYAEYYAVDASQVAHKPITVSFQEAAGVSLAGTTAWQAIFDAGHLKSWPNCPGISWVWGRGINGHPTGQEYWRPRHYDHQRAK